MASNVITDIESKNKATKHLNLSSLFFILGYIIVSYMFKTYVNELLIIPYMLFNTLSAIYLVLPSRYNKGRTNLASIFVMFRKDIYVYRPYFAKEYIDEQS